MTKPKKPFTAPKVRGYWQWHEEESPDGEYSHTSITAADRAAGWYEIDIETLAAAPMSAPSDAMVDAYLREQRRVVEEADRFGRPYVGGLHTNTVREACRAGIAAALAAKSQKDHG